MITKITPLNIVLACIIAWYAAEWSYGPTGMTWWGMLIFCVVLIVVDLIFRLFIKDVKKLWWSEIGFILLVAILIIIIKTVV